MSAPIVKEVFQEVTFSVRLAEFRPPLLANVGSGENGLFVRQVDDKPQPSLSGLPVV